MVLTIRVQEEVTMHDDQFRMWEVSCSRNKKTLQKLIKNLDSYSSNETARCRNERQVFTESLNFYDQY